MNEFDPKKIEALLADNKAQEAKEYLAGFLKRKMTDTEKADIHIDFALLQLKVENAVRQTRNEALRGILDNLHLINHSEKKLEEKGKLAEVRAKLKS